MPERQRKQHAEVAYEAGMRVPNEAAVAHMLALEAHIKSSGAKIYDTPSPDNDFWVDYYKLGFKPWPTIADFLHKLDTLYPNGEMVEFSFQDFARWVARQTEHVLENSSFMEMLVQPFRSKLKFVPELRRLAHPRSMTEALEAFWQWDKTHSRMRHPYIAIATEDEGDNVIVDEDDRHVLVYTRKLRQDDYVDVDRGGVVRLNPTW